MSKKPTSGKTAKPARRSAKKPVAKTIDLVAEDVSPKPARSVPPVKGTSGGGEAPSDAGPSKDAKPAAAAKAADTKPNPSAASATSTRKPEPAKNGRGGTGVAGLIGAGLVGALLALGGTYALQTARLLPSPGAGADAKTAQLQKDLNSLQSNLDQRLAELDGRVASIASSTDSSAGEAARADLVEQLNTLAARVDDVQQQTGELQASVSSGSAGEDAGLSALSGRIDALNTKIDELAGKGPSTTGPSTVDPGADQRAALLAQAETLATRIGAMETTIEGLPSSYADGAEINQSLSALRSRLDNLSGSLEAQSETLAGMAQKVAGGADKKVARALSAAALKADIDQGVPFASSLSTAKSVADDPSVLAPLDAYAQTGIPTVPQLATGFAGTLDAIIATEPKAQDDGTFSRLLAGAKSLVKVKQIGAATGNSVSARASRISASLQSGDLAAADAEWQSLPQAAKDASKKWHEGLAARMATNQLMPQIVQSFVAPQSGN